QESLAPPLRSITYRLSMSRPVSHLFEVAIIVELPEQLKDEPLQFQMAKWSPGRYGVFDFAKNVQEVRAVAENSATRPVKRVDDQTWSVAPLGSTTLTLSYKVFGNDLSGTFSQLDSRHANYNGGSIFMYVVDHKPDPVKLTIDPPAGWKIVNGRTVRAGQTEWQFPNWDVMIDTPTEIAPDWTQDNFEVNGKKYHVVVHSFGPEGGKRPGLVADIEKIVRAEVAIRSRLTGRRTTSKSTAKNITSSFTRSDRKEGSAQASSRILKRSYVQRLRCGGHRSSKSTRFSFTSRLTIIPATAWSILLPRRSSNPARLLNPAFTSKHSAPCRMSSFTCGTSSDCVRRSLDHGTSRAR